MNRVLTLAALALLMFTPAANAAGPWQSCYLGGHVGASAVLSGLTSFSGLAGIDSVGGAGVSGGATGGCDLQITGTPLVAGVWGDYTEHSADVTMTWFGSTATASLDRQWAAGGKLGVALGDSSLLYGVAGYTRAYFSTSDNGGMLSITAPNDMSGYLLGGGLETKVPGMHGLSIDARYTFSRLDRDDFNPIDVHTARVGVTYRFGMDRVAADVLK